jgi:hypothetical protein
MSTDSRTCVEYCDGKYGEGNSDGSGWPKGTVSGSYANNDISPTIVCSDNPAHKCPKAQYWDMNESPPACMTDPAAAVLVNSSGEGCNDDDGKVPWLASVTNDFVCDYLPLACPTWAPQTGNNCVTKCIEDPNTN